MAPVTRRQSQVSNVLLLIALACASGWSTSRAAVLEAGNRKLLQGGNSSSSSTPFGNLAPGTLVVTFSAVPAKHAPTFASVEGPPYQYDWFNLYLPGSGNVSLIFYPTDVYVTGPGNQRTQLTSSGSCDLVTTEYPDEMSLINSCRGAFTAPANLPAVSAVYLSLQAPAGLEFQVPTPFNGFQCTGILFQPFNPSYSPGIYANGSYEAVFDTGDNIPLKPGQQIILGYAPSGIVLSVNAQPFTSTGTLTFQSINLRAQYESPVQFPQGTSLSWVIPYPYCFFASKQVTVQSVGTNVPSSTSSPMNICQNGGIPIPGVSPTLCACPSGYLGSLCQIPAAGPEPYST